MTARRHVILPRCVRCPNCGTNRGHYQGQAGRKYPDMRMRLCDNCGHRWPVEPLAFEVDRGGLRGVLEVPELGSLP